MQAGAPRRDGNPKPGTMARLKARKDAIGVLARCFRAAPAKRKLRTLWANDAAANEGEMFVSNEVITSRYTWYSFLPEFLYAQFRRFANFYFLIVCILQSIRSVSTTNGVPTSAIPLAFVLGFDATLTAIEDFNRHRDDARANARKVLALRNGAFVPIQWRDVQVGDVLKVQRGEEFPADLVFLAAGHEDEEQRGLCHVQTAQLDGETNLKLRKAHDSAVAVFHSDAACAGFNGYMICEEPTEHFGKFSGTLFMSPDDTRGLPIDANSTLLRGCVLRNVDYVYGLVVYTGQETKVRVKQQATRSKKAAVEKEINRYIVALVALQVAICAAGAIGYGVWTNANSGAAWYLSLSGADASDIVQRFFTYFLLISGIIPISLYVSMKLARTAQKFFMDRDASCVYVDEEAVAKSEGETGVWPLKVRSMDLNDECGQIGYVFTDKTGTLTSNYMEFRKLSVNGVAYGLGTTEIGMARRRRMGEDVTELVALMEANAKAKRTVAHVNYIDGSESEASRCLLGPASDLDGTGAAADPAQARALHLFMLQLSVNHTVVIETVHDKHTGAPCGTQLSASSPDEEAFVLAAKFFGYTFTERSKDTVKVSIKGREARFRVVAILPYTQMRKMASTIVEDMDAPSGAPRFYLLAKGADSKILSKIDTAPEGLSDEELEARATMVENTKKHMEDWAKDGLRTLCFGCKPLTGEEVDAWVDRFNEALASIEERQKKEAKLPNRIDEVMDEMESGLVLQGATANEDKLQEEVPETISLLSRAGIKIYMLTGDKKDTAINIAFATRMLNPEFTSFVYTSEDVDDYHTLAQTVADKAEEIRAMQRAGREFPTPLALVIDEPVIDMLLTGKANRDNLLTVAEACKTVVCCRCRPDQKKRMLELIRDGVPGARCMAVGDGANDVDMIQAANVGVGIAGAEGVQAANASDYAIGRFRFLQQLLLVHGRWNYTRMALLVCYMFYKNAYAFIAQVIFNVVAAWSGQKFYVELGSQTYNLIFTGVPILIVATLDQDVSRTNALRFPYLYTDGLFRRRLNLGLMGWWMCSAVYEAIMTFLFAYFGLGFTSYSAVTPYVFEFGTYVFTAVLVVVNLRVALNAASHTAIFSWIVALSVILWVPIAFIFDSFDADNMKGGMGIVFSDPAFWLFILLIAVATQVHVLAASAARRWYAPQYRDLVREYQILHAPAGTRPTRMQRLLTCGMRRLHVRVRPTPQELLTKLQAEMDVAEARAAAAPAAAGGPLTAADKAALNLYPANPRFSLRPRPDWRTLYVAEDVAEDLVEWPYEQSIIASTQAYAAGGATRPDVERKRRELIKARLTALIEETPQRPAPPGAGMAVTVHAAAVTGAGTGTVAGAGPATAAVPAPRRTAAQRAASIFRLQTAVATAVSGPTRTTARRTGADFSIDTSSAALGATDRMSSVGRRFLAAPGRAIATLRALVPGGNGRRGTSGGPDSAHVSAAVDAAVEGGAGVVAVGAATAPAGLTLSPAGAASK